MYTNDIETIQRIITEKIPPGSVIPRHDETGHWYEVVPLGRILGSVTGAIQFIKDPSLINFYQNRTLDAIRQYWRLFTDQNLEDMLKLAKDTPVTEFMDAGEIGSQVHHERELYMRQWIETKIRPERILDFHKDAFDNGDRRGKEKNLQVIAALRAVEKFVQEYDYIPAVCELYVYSDELNLAGTLDDLGTMRVVYNKGNEFCLAKDSHRFNKTCKDCGYRARRELVLIDIKTSNQFKDHYWIQVILYYYMFYRLTNLKPRLAYIIKCSKEDGFYKPEMIKELPTMIKIAKSAISFNSNLQYVRKLRQRETIKI